MLLGIRNIPCNHPPFPPPLMERNRQSNRDERLLAREMPFARWFPLCLRWVRSAPFSVCVFVCRSVTERACRYLPSWRDLFCPPPPPPVDASISVMLRFYSPGHFAFKNDSTQKRTHRYNTHTQTSRNERVCVHTFSCCTNSQKRSVARGALPWQPNQYKHQVRPGPGDLYGLRCSV